MAALATAVANIYEPAIWSKYLVDKTTALSLLVQSGIAGTDPDITAAANEGGRLVNLPFWNDLAHDTGATTRSKIATDDDTAIVPAGVTTGKDIAVKHFRTQDFQTASIVRYVAGSDPAALIMDRYAEWWRKEEQRLLLKTLTGMFADATVAAALSYDVAGEVTTSDPAKLISSVNIEHTRFLLGDHFGTFKSIIMHSVPFANLRKLDLIDMQPDSQQNPTIPFYMGLRVIVDDGMTVVAGGTSGFKYHSFLFGAGAIAREDVPLESGDPNMEVWRDPTKGTGSGSVDIITRRYFILHPRGIAWTGTAAGLCPSDAELAADNWTQAYLTKNLRIARLITNG